MFFCSNYKDRDLQRLQNTADEVVKIFQCDDGSIVYISYSSHSLCSLFIMACPFLEDVLDEETIILRRAFKHERVFQDRSDQLAFGDDYLIERYRFSGDELR